MKLSSNAKAALLRYGLVAAVFFVLGCLATHGWVDRLVFVDESEFGVRLEAAEA